MAEESLIELPIEATINGFASSVLGIDPYDWQSRALLPIELWNYDHKPRRIAVLAPNGSGKDGVIIPVATTYFLTQNERGRVLITSKSATQLDEQTIPHIERNIKKLGWAQPTKSPRFHLVTPTGGVLNAFVTNEGARIEGWHSRPDEPLMVIVNEAKFLSMNLWEGIDRCTIDILIVISSPGPREGRLFDCFNKLRPLYQCINAGLADCPHITQEHIDETIAKYGPDHAITRSTLHGEFMDQQEGDQFVTTIEQIESNIAFAPAHRPGFKAGFWDFAEGRAENVLAMRNGNRIWIEDAWREQNEDAVVGRAIYLMQKTGLKPSNFWGDAAAKSILDKLAASGWPIGRQNFGLKLKNSPYQSWSAKVWREGADAIRNRTFILPDDELFKAQACSRKKTFVGAGLLGVEEKVAMRKRGVESPDRPDAVFGVMSLHDDTLDVPQWRLDLSDLGENLKREDSDLAGIAGY